MAEVSGFPVTSITNALQGPSSFGDMDAALVSGAEAADARAKPRGDAYDLLVPYEWIHNRGRLRLAPGQLLALRVHHLVHTMMNLHLSLGVPMAKRNIHPLRQCIEILKAIEQVSECCDSRNKHDGLMRSMNR